MNCTALAWFGSVIVAAFGAVQCFSVPRERNDDRTEEGAVAQPKQGPTVIATEVSDDEQ